jgi:hypothetical protein
MHWMTAAQVAVASLRLRYSSAWPLKRAPPRCRRSPSVRFISFPPHPRFCTPLHASHILVSPLRFIPILQLQRFQSSTKPSYPTSISINYCLDFTAASISLLPRFHCCLDFTATSILLLPRFYCCLFDPFNAASIRFTPAVANS